MTCPLPGTKDGPSFRLKYSNAANFRTFLSAVDNPHGHRANIDLECDSLSIRTRERKQVFVFFPGWMECSLSARKC